MGIYKKYNLLIDDERTLEMCFELTRNTIYNDLDWIIVRNYDDFCEIILENGMPDIISFDHDIADFKDGIERDGRTCAWFIVNYCMDNDLDIPDYLIHSANNQAIKRIGGLLDNFSGNRN